MSGILLRQLKEDEVEDEEDLPLSAGKAAELAAPDSSSVQTASEEFTEALSAIAADKWDTNNWVVYIEEVEQGRSGSVLVSEAYTKFLAIFPLAGHFWNALIDYHVNRDELQLAEDLFNKCLKKCRNIILWQSYFQFVRKKISKNKKSASSSNESVSAKSGFSDGERKLMESAFDDAIDNVGLSIKSDDIWRDYIDFVREWPESSPVEQGRKIVALRKIYQKALTIPTESLDTFWKEYELLERSAGEHLAEKLLPEYQEKYLHARVVYRERSRYAVKINFDRLACPPQKSLQELQQLDSWNKWLRYEMTNPDNLSVDAHKHMMNMIYDQCLCCFQMHPEVWMGRARFEMYFCNNPMQARNVYRHAIDTIPSIAYLRIALSELEESQKKVSEAKETLKLAFEKIPSGLTFAVYQRFLRRYEGIDEARKLFSETHSLRNDHTLGVEVFISHAQLELEVNCNPSVAIRVLELAKLSHPHCVKDVRFVRVMTQCLIRIGDIKQIQWLFQVALGQEAVAVANVSSNLIGNPPASIVGGSGGATKENLVVSGIHEMNSVNNTNALNERSLQETVQLWDDYLNAESILGVSDLNRMNEIRLSRDKARLRLDELLRAKYVASSTETTALNSKFRDRTKVFGIFETAGEITERYEVLACTYPVDDEDLRERSKGKLLLHEMLKQENDRMTALKEAGVKRSKKDQTGGDVDDGLNLPQIIRDLLPKLSGSSSNVPMPDLNGFIKHLRGLVLPPRPSVMTSVADDLDNIDRKPLWLTGGGGDDEDDVEDTTHLRDDIFRRRQRARLGY